MSEPPNRDPATKKEIEVARDLYQTDDIEIEDWVWVPEEQHKTGTSRAAEELLEANERRAVSAPTKENAND